MNWTTLINQAKNHDPQAWTELFERTQSMVYFTAVKLIGDEDAAQDIVQETYFSAYRHLDSLKDPGAFPGWIKRIAANMSKNYLAAKKPDLFGSDEIDAMLVNEPETHEEFLPQEYADRQETCRLIMNIIDNLDKNKRDTIIYYYHCQMSIAEVADMMKEPISTITKRLERARNEIKRQVKDLEKKGTKLHSTAIPVLALILHKAAADYNVPSATAANITTFFTQQCSAAAATATGAQTTSSASTTTSSVSSSTTTVTGSAATTVISSAATTKAAAGGLLAKLAAIPTVGKAIAGVAAACALGGAVLFGGGVGGDDTPVIPDTTQESTDDRNTVTPIVLTDTEIAQWKDNGMIQLMSLTKDQIMERFGTPIHTQQMDESHTIYSFVLQSKNPTEMQSILFSFEDNAVDAQYPIMIGFDTTEDPLTFHGISSMRSTEDVIQTLSAHGWTQAGDIYHVDDVSSVCDVVWNERPDISCTLQIKNGAVFFLSMHRYYELVSETTPEETVPAETTPTETIPEETETTHAEPTTEAATSLTNDQNRQILMAYYKANYGSVDTPYSFADVTHDGLEDMFLTYCSMDFAEFGVYTVIDGEVRQIYAATTASDTNSLYSYYLYEEDGIQYILYSGFFNRQGYPWYFYEIYHINENGEHITFKKREFSGEWSDDAQKEMDAIVAEYMDYRQQSKLIADIDEDGWAETGTW